MNNMNSLYAELAAKRVSAVDTLWRHIVGMEDHYSELLSLLNICTPQELSDALDGKHQGIMGMLESGYKKSPLREPGPYVTNPDIPATRPFVSERLWSLFFVIRAVYGRLAVLVGMSYEKKQYIDWATDDLMNTLVGRVLAPEVIARGKKRLGGFSNVICRNLETAFLEEARRVLDGNLTGGRIQDLPEVRVRGFGGP